MGHHCTEVRIGARAASTRLISFCTRVEQVALVDAGYPNSEKTGPEITDTGSFDGEKTTKRHSLWCEDANRLTQVVRWIVSIYLTMPREAHEAGPSEVCPPVKLVQKNACRHIFVEKCWKCATLPPRAAAETAFQVGGRHAPAAAAAASVPSRKPSGKVHPQPIMRVAEVGMTPRAFSDDED